jgi:hypothetical protein
VSLITFFGGRVVPQQCFLKGRGAQIVEGSLEGRTGMNSLEISLGLGMPLKAWDSPGTEGHTFASFLTQPVPSLW